MSSPSSISTTNFYNNGLEPSIANSQKQQILPQISPNSTSTTSLQGGQLNNSANMATNQINNIDSTLHGVNRLGRVKSLDTCRVCGDGPARMHYGVPTCFGCKGFFRRTLKRTKDYTCRYNGTCVVDRYERNSCRYCRFKRCLEVGMDPKAVRPDRDAAGRTHCIRRRQSRNSVTSTNDLGVLDEESSNGSQNIALKNADDWIRKLPVDMRTLLMQIMNAELMIANGDTQENPKNIYPLEFGSLREILVDPALLDGKRTEMRYEPYRQVEPDEIIAIAHRRLIAVIDMVDHLCVMMDLHNIQDKIALVKAAYAPLTIFCCVAATARVTKNRDVLCLCNFGCVPRGTHNTYQQAYHFANRVVDRILDELVEPFRAFNFKEQEVILMKAIVTLNPHIRSLSTEAAEQVADLRDRVQETLYNVVRESHPKEVASSRFGNLLLFLPNIMILGNVMYENLQFIQSFGKQHIDPLLSELLDNIEPMDDLNGINFDDVISISSEENNLMCHSQSVSSISSLNSSSNAPDSSSFTNSFDNNNSDQLSLLNLPDQQYYYNGRRASMSQIGDSIHLNLICSKAPNNTESSLNSENQSTDNNNPDSDPDYNITLTADNFSGIRNAMANQSIMDFDSSSSEINNEYYNNQIQQQQKPLFFIDSSNGYPQQQHKIPQQQQQQQIASSATKIGSKHVFTVETTKDTLSYNNNNSCHSLFPQQQQQKFQQNNCYNNDNNQFTNVSSESSMSPQQQPISNQYFIDQNSMTISKSQSYPYVNTTQQQQQFLYAQQNQQQQQPHQNVSANHLQIYENNNINRYYSIDNQ